MQEKIIEGINKTGFKLEFEISKALRSNNWNVINSKYYLDDVSGIAREMDIVAYKVTKVKHLYVYTALIISCKKNEESAWALLSKKIDVSDPNVEWAPLHLWSNDKVIKHLSGLDNWKNDYIESVEINGSKLLSRVKENQIFAFQEINKKNGVPKNDKNIFNSINSLMKAQSYEINALNSRKEETSIYQFNLISIMDTELFRVDFTDENITASSVEDEFYISDYIIDKKQTSSKIHFINSKKIENKLKKYSELHEANVKSLDEAHETFFSTIMDDIDSYNLFNDEIENEIFWSCRRSLATGGFGFVDIRKADLMLYWNSIRGILVLEVSLIKVQVECLNNDPDVRKKLSECLNKYLSFSGKAEFASIFNEEIYPIK